MAKAPFPPGFLGIPICVGDSVPAEIEHSYEMPNNRFIDYDASDEPWMRYFGLGRRIMGPGLFKLNFDGREVFCCHPSVLEIVKAAIRPTDEQGGGDG